MVNNKLQSTINAIMLIAFMFLIIGYGGSYELDIIDTMQFIYRITQATIGIVGVWFTFTFLNSELVRFLFKKY